MKILLQQLWEQRVDWDDAVPQPIVEAWLQWRSELLNLLTKKHIPRCYFDKATQISTMQLHGFSDASERAYAAVIYLRMTDSSNNVQTSLVISKTKVAPIKRLTIPRLGTLWCLPTSPTASPRPSSVPTASQLSLCLDRQYHCPQLACWKSKKIQNLCWE